MSVARLGRGRARRGRAGAWHGLPQPGGARRGMPRPDPACFGRARQGGAGPGLARLGPAWVRHGTGNGLGRSRHNRRVKRMNSKATALGGDVTNGAAATIDLESPWLAEVTIIGTAALLFHRWQSDAVEAKARAAKGSAAKKSDDTESYLWRDENNIICLPGAYLAGAIAGPAGAAKYRQDPRSPRKSALDLFKAGVAVTTELAPLITADRDKATEPDYFDRRRVTVQRSGVTRVRPAFLSGWSATFDVTVLLPQYIDPALLHDVLIDAGRLVGIADFRPTHGRFQVASFVVRALT